jgi:hypothetical protein
VLHVNLSLQPSKHSTGYLQIGSWWQLVAVVLSSQTLGVCGDLPEPCRPAGLQSFVKKPAGTLVQLNSVGGELEIEIPPRGLSRGCLQTCLFVLIWNLLVILWRVRCAWLTKGPSTHHAVVLST